MPACRPFIVTNAPAQPTNTFAVYRECRERQHHPTDLIPYQAQVGDTVALFQRHQRGGVRPRHRHGGQSAEHHL